jgi:outer membrane biogenesis lipoprotein LolB
MRLRAATATVKHALAAFLADPTSTVPHRVDVPVEKSKRYTSVGFYAIAADKDDFSFKLACVEKWQYTKTEYHLDKQCIHVYEFFKP